MARDVEIPDELEEALRDNPEARSAFESMPPSHRREYLEWITESRREATRRQRVEEALAMMLEWGRQRNGGQRLMGTQYPVT